MKDRIPVRLYRMGEEPTADDDLRHLKPEERMALVWPLTIQAWAFKGVDIAEQRLPRHVVRLVRRES